MLKIFVCPEQFAARSTTWKLDRIMMRTCGYRYPVRDNIPVMLIDEAEKPGSKKARGKR